jgi:hypothetical protein
MRSFMTGQKADFVKLFGFFLYQRTPAAFAYYDLEKAFTVHFLLAPLAQALPAIDNGQMSGEWGNGFSFVFRRAVWEAVHFPDQSHNEDYVFARAVLANGNFTCGGKHDRERSCIHIIHAGNSSVTYPQQILPIENVLLLFPNFPHFRY